MMSIIFLKIAFPSVSWVVGGSLNMANSASGLSPRSQQKEPGPFEVRTGSTSGSRNVQDEPQISHHYQRAKHY